MSGDRQDVPCKMQRGEKMPVGWCDLVQFAEICEGCPYNKGRDVSLYQKEIYGK